MRINPTLIALSAAAALATPAFADEEKLAFLGVGTAPVHPTLAAQLELEDGAGLAVRNVMEGSPAAKAGIREHDILAAFEGTALTSPEQLRELVMTREPGDEVEVTLIRQAKEESLKVTLGELPEELAAAGGRPAARRPGFGGAMPGMRFDFGDLPDGFKFGGPADVEELMEEMMKKVDPDGVRGFGVPGFPGKAGGATSHSSVNIDDGTHKIEMETRDGVSTVKAYDSEGKLLFEGPYNTDEEKKLVPEDIRKKLDNIRSDFRVIPGFRAPGKDKPPVPTQKRTI